MYLIRLIIGLVVFFVLSIVVVSNAVIVKRRKGGSPSYSDPTGFGATWKGQATTKDDILKFEYEQTQEMLTHYDRLNLQIASIIVGSNIVGMSFVLGAPSALTSPALPGVAIAGMISLSIWVLWIQRHVAIYNVKNDRLYMIERQLDMLQHRMVGFADNNHWLGSFSGRIVNLFLWAGLSVGWLFVFSLG